MSDNIGMQNEMTKEECLKHLDSIGNGFDLILKNWRALCDMIALRPDADKTTNGMDKAIGYIVSQVNEHKQILWDATAYDWSNLSNDQANALWTLYALRDPDANRWVSWMSKEDFYGLTEYITDQCATEGGEPVSDWVAPWEWDEAPETYNENAYWRNR